MNRGIASLYVMFIFIAASIVAAGLVQRQHMELTRTSHFIDDMQMMEYAQSGEDYARQILYDYIQQKTPDNHALSWASTPPPFQTPTGAVTLVIEDLGGRFNVNNLFTGSGDNQDYFRALCTQIGVTLTTANALIARVAPPKTNSDSAAVAASNSPTGIASTSSNGTGTNTPAGSSAASSQPTVVLQDPSQLLDYRLPVLSYFKLAPYLTALPAAANSININAASDVILKADGVTQTQISAIRSAIAQNGAIGKDTLGNLNLSATNLVTDSTAFAVHITATLNGRAMRLNSTLWIANASTQATTGSTTPAPATAPTPTPDASATTTNNQSQSSPPRQIITIARTWGN